MRAIPPAFKNIQVNGCKTPGCNNFGVSPREGPMQVGRGASSDGYVIIKTGSTTITCKECGVSTKLKSNKAIFEEFERQGDQIWNEPGLRCPNDGCANSNPLDANFKMNGSTRSGSQRFQCLACKTTFSIGKSTLRQRLTPNYDPSITQNDLEALWTAADDQSKPTAMRETARLWTRADYNASTARQTRPSPEAQESVESLSDGQQLPKSGCQVHADYLMYGHYWLLRHHLQGAGKIRFFLDGDSGLLAACIAALPSR
jgi:hypothetical protein